MSGYGMFFTPLLITRFIIGWEHVSKNILNIQAFKVNIGHKKISFRGSYKLQKNSPRNVKMAVLKHLRKFPGKHPW